MLSNFTPFISMLSYPSTNARLPSGILSSRFPTLNPLELITTVLFGGQSKLWVYIYIPIHTRTGTSGRMVWGVGLRTLACWDCGFESRRGMDVCLLWVLYAIKYRSLRRADHSSSGVLTKVVCLYDEKTSYSRPRSMTAVETREKYTYTIYTLVNTS